MPDESGVAKEEISWRLPEILITNWVAIARRDEKFNFLQACPESRACRSGSVTHVELCSLAFSEGVRPDVPNRTANPCFCRDRASPGSARAQSVDEVITSNIKARGGLEKIKAVRSVRTTSKLTVGSFRAAYVQE